MSNIINKSNHPVEIKKIPIRTWRLREEIEAAIAVELELNPDTPPNEVDITNIKEYYIGILNQDINTPSDEATPEEDSNLDSSGNPMDDDALAMMAALGGGEESSPDTEEASEDKADEQQDSDDSEEASEEDDEAAAMADAMLADQGMGENEDDDAAALAAQMLADQGMREDDDITALAPQMLADQAPDQDEAPAESKPFQRIKPLKQNMGEGFVLLSDMQMDHILFFSNRPYIHGQNIIIEFVIPKPFNIMVEVSMISNVGKTSKIIRNNSSPNRIAGKMLYKFPGERSQLREFLQSIEPEIPEPPKKLKKPDSDDDDDDFDDLGF